MISRDSFFTAPLMFLFVIVMADPATCAQVLDPPESPVTWEIVDEQNRPLSAGTPSFDILGGPCQEAMARTVELVDIDPFGESGRRNVSLVRCDSLQVLTPDSSAAVEIALNAAFDIGTGQLVCAFTDRGTTWATTTMPRVQDVDSFVTRFWKPSPARYSELRSTVSEVLHAAWRRFGVDPSRAWQLVVRPRYVVNEYPRLENGEPKFPPSNVWIFESLGTFVLERHGVPLTTLVAQFRDGDLEGWPGKILP